MHNQQLKGFFLGVGTTALLAFGLMGLTGFQANSPKVGIIDFAKAFNDTPLLKNQDEANRQAERNRQGIIDFVNTYPTITREQATRFRALSTKTNLTDAERSELDKLKNEVIADEKKARDLQTKPNPTQEDLKAIEAYRTRQQSTREMLGSWVQEFRGEIAEQRGQANQEIVTKMRSIVAEVGKREGYSVIYEAQFAPYAANDVTKQVQEAAVRAR